MKIAVVGCGAVGSYYGAKLWAAGHETHFLLRSDYDVVRRNGVRIRSYQGDFTAHPYCAREPGEIGPSELVLIALKTTANDQFARLLPPLVGPQTVLMTLQNGLGNPERLAGLFPAEQVMGGHCFVCLNRVEPGVVVHTDHGQIAIGEYIGGPRPRTHQIADVFRRAGVQCDVVENLGRAHWEKLLWNIPFNGLGVAGAAGPDALDNPELATDPMRPLGPCPTTDKLIGDEKWFGIVRELMAEVTAVANALGFNIPDTFADELITKTRTMGAYKASTLIDFERGKPLELESMFIEPLRQARAAGVHTPRLAALCEVLCALDKRRQIQQVPSA
ncbi:MAG: 2-dehydropantoate 2-reductase [Verrucomicrobiae bacterium]|nr:2-dehydropantoate 2-reductase [Verrucomicrobiae bacterium]